MRELFRWERLRPAPAMAREPRFRRRDGSHELLKPLGFQYNVRRSWAVERRSIRRSMAMTLSIEMWMSFLV